MNEYVYVGSRKWIRPRLTVYKCADRQWRFLWNRYPGVTIGAAIVLGNRVIGVTWAQPSVKRRAQ